jgi:hypothetical protein
VAKKEKRERFVSPVATGAFLALTSPYTKKGANDYIAKVAFDPSNKEHAEFLKKLDGLNRQMGTKCKEDFPKYAKTMKLRKLAKPEMDSEDQPTGRMFVVFKQKAEAGKGDKKFTFKVAVFDAKGKPLSKDIKIGAGTQVKVAFEVDATFYEKERDGGARLRLVAAQIVKLVEWEGGTAESFGFSEEEGFDSVDALTEKTEDGEAEEETPEAGAEESTDF